MSFEWYLKHRDGTKCMPYVTPFEQHAWVYAYGSYQDAYDMRVHPAQLAYFELDQEFCLGVDLETGYEYWCKRVE